MPTIVLTGGSSTKQLRIAYDSLLNHSDATITCDSEVAGYEHANAANWQAYNFWQPATAGAHYIQAVFPSARTVNYFAFYAHTFATNGATITLQSSIDSGATWVDVVSATPSTSAPVYAVFAPVSANYWRVTVTSTPASLLGVVAFGSDLLLPRGVWDGFSPPLFARDTAVTNATSMTGVFLGRSIIKSGSKTQLDLAYMPTSWMRTNWLGFQKSAELQPFFLLWNGFDYPDEAAYCWSDGMIDKPKIQITSFMSTTFKFLCRID